MYTFPPPPILTHRKASTKACSRKKARGVVSVGNRCTGLVLPLLSPGALSVLAPSDPLCSLGSSSSRVVCICVVWGQSLREGEQYLSVRNRLHLFNMSPVTSIFLGMGITVITWKHCSAPLTITLETLTDFLHSPLQRLCPVLLLRCWFRGHT